MDDNEAEINEVHEKSVATARTLGLLSKDGRARAPTLQFPMRLRANSKSFGAHHIGNYVDLISTSSIKDFACGKRSYKGHNGVDITLSPFWWRMMDAAEAEIVAAAPGRIVNKVDGNFDRQCSLPAKSPANLVEILQDDGIFAISGHLKKGSVIKQPIGSRVTAGQVLGLVGSSGNSVAPHLHFELRTASAFRGKTVDPYAGVLRRCWHLVAASARV